MSKKHKDKVKLYDLASDSMVEVGQPLADRLARNEHLMCVYVRAQMALMAAIAATPHDGPYTDPARLLTLASVLALTPSDEYKRLAAKVLGTS